MFSCFILLVVSLGFLRDFHVSSCDPNCTDKPVFTPSRLVVKHGDAASATCYVCQSGCNDSKVGLEYSLGERTINGTMISWKIDRMTEWGTELMCYYTDDVNNLQCCSTLPVIVYKPPDNLSLSFGKNTEPMFEDHQYTLLCAVHNVAPVENISVTFYRGKTSLGQPQFISNTHNKPVTEIYNLTITPSKEDDGAQYWCEAQLELGVEGPQSPPVVKSQHITSTVYYKPQLVESSHSDKITVTQGDPLHLNCSAVGNPTPSYTWTLPLADLPHLVIGSVLTVQSVTFEHEGKYTCSVRNMMADVDSSFHVEVKVNYKPYIIAAVVLVVLILTCGLVGYILHYRRNRMGHYKPTKVVNPHKQPQPSDKFAPVFSSLLLNSVNSSETTASIPCLAETFPLTK